MGVLAAEFFIVNEQYFDIVVVLSWGRDQLDQEIDDGEEDQ